MNLAKSFLPEYDHEMALTRKILERFPEQHADYRPHEKSMTLSRLASHVGEIPGWVAPTMENDVFDMHPPGGEPFQSPHLTTREELLQAFDRDVVAGRESLAATSDEQMMGTWSMHQAGKPLMSLPRMAVMRGFILNHLVHHRAQLGLYYRLLDVPVPAIYGPSADEAS